MSRRPTLDPTRVQGEIAVTAVYIVAGDGVDYTTAKRRTTRQVLGTESCAPGEWLPDNKQAGTGVHKYQALFQIESQPHVLALLRCIALVLMEGLTIHNSCLTGAVFNSTTSKHSDIHLQIFCDNPKDVAVLLLNAGVGFETTKSVRLADYDEVETLGFL